MRPPATAGVGSMLRQSVTWSSWIHDERVGRNRHPVGMETTISQPTRVAAVRLRPQRAFTQALGDVADAGARAGAAACGDRRHECNEEER